MVAPYRTDAEIVVSEFMDDEAIGLLSTHTSVLYDPGLADNRVTLLETIGSARALVVRNRTIVDSELLDAGSSLIAVGRLGVGLDNIDLDECRRRRITVWPAIGANADAVAEYVIGVLLMLFRGVFNATNEVVTGAWPRSTLVGREIGGRRLGLVGLGSVARVVASRAIGMGMEVVAFDPLLDPGDPVWDHVESMAGLEELLRTCDAVSLHIPLVEETRGIIDEAALAAMPLGAVLVNTARGGVVNEDALVDALERGHLGGAAIDVFVNEPVDERAGAKFAGVPNLVLTPHVAGVTLESNGRVSRVTAANVLRELGFTNGG